MAISTQVIKERLIQGDIKRRWRTAVYLVLAILTFLLICAFVDPGSTGINFYLGNAKTEIGIVAFILMITFSGLLSCAGMYELIKNALINSQRRYKFWTIVTITTVVGETLVFTILFILSYYFNVTDLYAITSNEMNYLYTMLIISLVPLILVIAAIYQTHTLRSVAILLIGLIEMFLTVLPIIITFLIFNRGGWLSIILVLAMTTMMDSFAYLGGVTFGKHKLAPKISPNKTWEGLIFALISCAVILTALSLGWIALDKNGIFPPFVSIITTSTINQAGNILAFLTILLGSLLCAAGGDLMFSLLKRQLKIKDYSHLLPGHGGVLDRFDSLIITLPSFVILLVVFGTILA